MTKERFEKYFKEWVSDLKDHKGWIIKVANVSVDMQTYRDKYEEMYPDMKPEALERELIQWWMKKHFSLPTINKDAFSIIKSVESYGVNDVVFISSLYLNAVAQLDEMQKTENLPLLDQKLVQELLRRAIALWALITIYANRTEINKYEDKKSIVKEIKADK